MNDLVCPKCKQTHLRIHSTLVSSECTRMQDVHYEWECGWCGHHEGDYKTPTEAKEDYNRKYGGINQ